MDYQTNSKHAAQSPQSREKTCQRRFCKWAKIRPPILSVLKIKARLQIGSIISGMGTIQMNAHTYHCCTSFSVTAREMKSDISSEENF